MNSRLRNALLLAGGLAVGGSIPAAMSGCGTPESETREHVGHTQQALSTGWNAPTTPNLGLVGNSGITRVERSGSNITVYVANNPGSNADILKVGTTDGTNWNSPSATSVPGANSVQHDTDFKVCGTDAYIVSERDGLSSKLYKGSWSGGTVGVLSPVPGTINSDFSNVQSVACNNAETKIYATSDVTSTNLKIHTADIGTWTWSEVTSCNDPTKDTYEMFVDANDFYFSSNRGGTLGSFDLMAMKWDGTNCSAPLTNLNSIAGSAAVNNVNYQGSPVIDNVGDLWFTDNGVIKWATAKSVVLPDGGTDGGDADAGVDSGTDGGDADAGVDSGADGGDADAGSDAGADSGTDGGTDAGDTDAGLDGGTDAGDTDAGTDAGTDSGAGGSDGGTDAGTGGSDAGAGGDTGTGGSGGDAGVDCFAKATANAANFKVDSCNATTVSAHISAPTTFQVGNKTCTVTEGSGTVDFALPNFMQFSTGVAYECGEPQSETDKIISKEGGIWLGFEGTKTSRTYPGNLNPNKAKGVFDVVAYTTIEGSQSAYDNTCVPKNNSVADCNPVDFTVPGGKKGQIPAGTTMYRELSTGKVVDDPSKFNTVDPVPANTDQGGCSIARNSTREDLNATLIGLGILAAAAVARRRERKA